MANNIWDYVTFTGEDQCAIDSYKAAYEMLMTEHADIGVPIFQQAYEMHGKPVQIDISYSYPMPKYDLSTHAIWVNPALVEQFYYTDENGTKYHITPMEFLAHEGVHAGQDLKEILAENSFDSSKTPDGAPTLSLDQMASFQQLNIQLLQSRTEKEARAILEDFWADGGEKTIQVVSEIRAMSGATNLDHIIETPAIKAANEIRARVGKAPRTEYAITELMSEKDIFITSSLTGLGFITQSPPGCEADQKSQNRFLNDYTDPNGLMSIVNAPRTGKKLNIGEKLSH